MRIVNEVTTNGEWVRTFVDTDQHEISNLPRVFKDKHIVVTICRQRKGSASFMVEGHVYNVISVHELEHCPVKQDIINESFAAAKECGILDKVVKA